MTGLRQNIQQKLARELSERGETPIAGEPGAEPVTAVENLKAQLQQRT